MSDKLQKQIENELDEARQQEYQEIVKATKPKTPFVKNAVLAFLVGGAICVVAQLIEKLLLMGGVGRENSVTLTLVILIFLGAFLTGLGVYDKLGRFAGGGSIVPISGFANSIVSPAMEWRREGMITGLAAKMFTVAGPVIVYGIFGALLLGAIKYLWLLATGGL